MDDLNSEQTLPPARATRFDRVDDLFRKFEQIGQFMTERPTSEEGYRAFLQRLRLSHTPEDAVIFIAFAVEAREAIQWALDSVLDLQPEISAEDTQLVNWIAAWLEDSSAENRWKTLQLALFAPRKTAIVSLGLAVGWSGGPLAPNDLVTVPAWRAPHAISAAVLRAVGQKQTDQRASSIDHVLDRAAGLLRIAS